MLNRFMEWIADRIRLRLIGPTLLQDIHLLPLGASIDEATSLYGPATEKTCNDDFPESTGYSFEASPYHAVDVWIWKSRASAVVYHSAKGDSELDLKTVRDAYGEGQEWQTTDEGYKYLRADGQVRLWCSAAPAIGIGSEAYLHCTLGDQLIAA